MTWVVMCCIVFKEMTAEFANQMKDWRTYLYSRHILHSSSFFPLTNMLPANLNKICVRILTLLLGFSISVLLMLSEFTSGEIWSDFIWERKFESKWIAWHHFFGLSFWAAFTLRILSPIIPFWSIWTLSQISHFSACRVQFSLI